MNDRRTLQAITTGITETYGRDFSPSMLELWWQCLAEYPDAMVSEAVLRHIKDPEAGSYFPKPADIIRHCNDIRRIARLKKSTDEALLLPGPKPEQPAWVQLWIAKYMRASAAAKAAGEPMEPGLLKKIIEEAKAEAQVE